MVSSLRSKHKASRECCQAIGRDVRIIHHRVGLYPHSCYPFDILRWSTEICADGTETA